MKAIPGKVYRAFTDPTLLEKWLVPGEMKGKIGKFELRVGGGYDMCLQYPDSDSSSAGKTTSKEDRYHTNFLELIPGKRILQSITFDTEEKQFQGEMLMDVVLEEQYGGTLVTITFKNIPIGIKPEDNEKGTDSSLQKLAALVE